MYNLFFTKSIGRKRIVAIIAALTFLTGNVTLTPSLASKASVVNTKVAAATVKSVENLSDLYVDNGTSLAALQKVLPQKVNVVMSDSTKSTATVKWDLTGYVSTTKSTKTYNFIGTVEGTKTTAKIKVILANPFITSIKAPAAISVANGTKVDKLNLPKTVDVVKSDKKTSKAKVVWNTSSYNGNVTKATNFVLTGKVEGTEKTTTITVKVGNPFISSAAAPKDLYVDNGTTADTLQKLLPNTVAVVMSNGLKSTAAVTWDLKGYVATVKSVKNYTFTGTVKGTKITTKIRVIVANPFISSVKAPTAITVANGTTLEKLNLPKTVDVVMSDKKTSKAKVVWDTSKYDGNVAKETIFIFTGDVDGTEKTTTISVTVRAPHIVSVTAPATVSVENGTTLNIVKNKLPDIVAVKLSNGTSTVANVTWDTSGYNGNVTKETVYNFKGTIEGTKDVSTVIAVKVGAPFIVTVKSPASLTVDNGTTNSQLESRLPKTVEVVLSNGTTNNAKVSWDISSYNSGIREARGYTFTGSVEGTSNIVTIYVYVNAYSGEQNETPYVVSVVNPEAINVNNGTSANALSLPTSVRLNWSNGNISSAAVTWDTSGYDGNTTLAKAYSITGSVSGTEKTATVIVNVGAPFILSVAQTTPIAVDNGTSTEELLTKLPTSITLNWSNATSSSAVVTWDAREFDGNTTIAKAYSINGTVADTERTVSIVINVGAPFVKAITEPAAITVPNGTTVEELQEILPTTVAVRMSNGRNSIANVEWDSKDYDGNTREAVTYTLTGGVEGTDLTTKIVVNVGEAFIVSVVSPSAINVANGTTIENISLPTTVEVSLSNSTKAQAKVEWNTTEYNGNVQSVQSFNLPGNVEGTDIKANLTINVGAPYIAAVTQPEALHVENGTPLQNLLLPETVEVTWSNGVKASVPVVWDTREYNGNVSEAKKYIFSGAVSGTTITTTIEVNVAAPQQAEDPWTLVWSDEFDRTGANLDTNGVDLAKWGYQNGTGAQYGLDGWGNNEQQYYSKNNIEVKNGNLVITPKMETVSGKPYTSGRLWTSPTYAKKYGKFEARIKLPAGEGFWPAFWMMPKNDVYGGWASSGELDIMEARGRLLDHVDGTIHYGGSWPNNKYTGSNYYFPEGEDITGFHTYSVEWEPGEIRWYVDGNLYQTQNNWYTVGRDGEEKFAFPAPFDQEFYIILNLAIGGNYDGGRQPNASAFANNPTMEVDYVRVYDLTGRPYKTPVEPKVPVEPLPAGARVPDSTGNLVNDMNFENGIKTNREGVDADFGDGWNFIYNAQFGGAATATVESINGRNFAKIDVTNAGSQPYSVQLEQHTTLGKGRWYEFSFDAKADRNRTLNAKLGGGPTRGWTDYSDSYTLNLTNQIQSFKRVFQMTKDSNILTRIEFNCATATGPVWIGNVRLVEIDPPSEDFNKSKDPLPNSGSYVYNGAFDKYTVDRLAYWKLNVAAGASATMNVPEATRELNVDIVDGGEAASAVTVEQGGIQLSQNNGYFLTFKAKAAANRTAKVRLMSKDGATTFAEREINLTTDYNQFELAFTMTNVTDLESKLVFMLGGNNSKVYLDNVKLVKTTIDYSGVDLYPLKNGDFSSGLTGWESILDSGGAAATTVVNGEANVSITAVGNNPWSVMLNQGAMSFAKGIEYTFSFKAKASVGRSIQVVLENASYARAFDSQAIALTTEWQTFSYTVKPSVSETLALKYLLGKVDAAAAVGTVLIDDVVLQVKNPPVKRAPMLVADSSDNMVGNAVDITFTDNVEWRTGISAVKLNGQVLAASKYTVSAGNISFAASNFTTAGSYTILVEAAGYANTTVVQVVKANDGKIVQNGTFSSGVTGWEMLTMDGSNAEISVESGELKVNFPNYDGWEIWSTQVNQGGIKLQAGKTYIVKFDARSTLAKPIKVEVDTFATPEIALTNTMQNYKYEFTATASGANTTLKFLLGSKNVGGPNFITHSIFLDNISIEEKVAEPPAVDNSIIKNGKFENGTTGWTAWWGDQWSGVGAGDLSVVNGKLKIHLTAIGAQSYAPQVLQEGFKLENGKTYVVSFKAKADAARKVNINIGKGLNEAPWFREYAQPRQVDLTNVEQAFSYEFTVNEATDTNLKLVFEIGNITGGNAITDIYLDDISIIEKPENILTNGNFNTDASGWTAWWGDQWSGVGAGNISVENGRLKIHLTAIGAQSYAPQVLQEGFQLEKGKTYRVSFKAKADIPRRINVNVGKGLNSDPWFLEYAESRYAELTTEELEYKYEFTVTEETDSNLKIVFEVGNVPGGNAVTDIYLDDISIIETSASEPALDKTSLAEKIAEANALNPEEYTLESWTMLQIVLEAANEVYNSEDVNQEDIDEILAYLTEAIYDLVEITAPGNTNLILNGSFDTNTANWTAWWGDQWSGVGAGTLSSEDGRLKIHLTALGNQSYAPQVLQEGFRLENGKTYVVKFKAKADIARQINVNIGKGLNVDPWFRAYAPGKSFNLTTIEQEFSYEFTVAEATDSNLKIVFEVGKIGSSAIVTDIYLDDISIEPKEDAITPPTEDEPSIITVEAENATVVPAGFTKEADRVSFTAPGAITFDVNVATAGNYKVTVYGLCSPNGIYFELQNSTGAKINGVGGPVSATFVPTTFDVTLEAGAQTLKLFSAPGANSNAALDKITFELQ